MLLDESLPRHLARELSGHQVETVQRRGWAGTKNGHLLRAAADAGFEVLLTGDQNLQYQQTLSKHSLGLVVVIAKSNRMEHLLPLIPEILRALAAVKPGSVLHAGE